MSSTFFQIDSSTRFLVTSETNPFCTRFVRPGAIHYRFTNDGSTPTTIHSIVEQMKRSRRSSIVGPHGTGKSTLLESMRNALHDAYHHIEWVQLRSSRVVSSLRNSDHVPVRPTAPNNRQLALDALQRLQEREVHDPHATALLLIDGFEQLTWLDRWKLTRNANRHGLHLLVTSHHRVRSYATVHRTNVDPVIVRQMTIDLATTGSQSAQKTIHHELGRRDLAKVDNIRDFWFELFDVVADAQSASAGVE